MYCIGKKSIATMIVFKRKSCSKIECRNTTRKKFSTRWFISQEHISRGTVNRTVLRNSQPRQFVSHLGPLGFSHHCFYYYRVPKQISVSFLYGCTKLSLANILLNFKLLAVNNISCYLLLRLRSLVNP